MKKFHIFGVILSLLLTKIDASANSLNESNNKSKGSKGYSKEIVKIPGFELFNTEIFSLSKKKEDAFDATSSIYVITSEDIRRSGATNIPEALRLAPGVQVARNNNHTWSISIRGFNEQFSNKLLVMIDGRTIYTSLFSGVFWNIHDYVLEDIEKIEVVKGSGGTIWGTNAVNGVINIITKNANSTQGSHISTIVGTEDKIITEARYGGRTTNDNHYRIYAKQGIRGESTLVNSGVESGDNFKTVRGGFRYDITSIKNNKLSFYGDVQTSKSNNYFLDVKGENGKTAHFYSQTGNISANWDKTISEKSSFTLNTYFNHNQFDANILRYINRTLDIDFQHFYDFNKNNKFIWGVGYRLINDTIGETSTLSDGVVLDYDNQEKNDEILSAFIQDKIGLIDQKLYLTIGSKFENNNYTGFEMQPNAKLGFYPKDNQTAWASVSRSVRTPHRGDEGATIAGVPGSTGFDSETLISYEAGYRIKPNNKTLFDISSFFNDYDKLLTDDDIVQNNAYAQSFGFELSSKWQVNKLWLLEAGYDFLRINSKVKDNNTSKNKEYEAAPRNQFRIRSNYNITPHIEFDNIFYYVDSVPSSGANGIPSYTRLDTRIGYLPNEMLELAIVGQNLTNKKHQEFGAPLSLTNPETEIGRAFYFKAVVKF